MPTSAPAVPRVALGAAAAACLLGAAGIVAGLRLTAPTPATVPVSATVHVSTPASYTVAGTPPQLPWPAEGQAAVEVPGVGSFGTSGAMRPVPIASVAKTMTAYVVLADHPLTGDGPTITVSPAEAAAYPAQAAANQSLVRVAAGEVLTERQALTALLLPSADNMAQILARWDAGTPTAFVAKMNAAAAKLGMADTHYTDASGLDKGTVSTAADQVKLAERAMAVPAFAQLVGLSQASIPVAGVVTNYNTLLGHDGIVGIKTGSTRAAGGCLLFAARFSAGGRQLMLLGAVLGQAGSPATLLPNVLHASQRLVEAGTAAVGPRVLVHAGDPVGTAGGLRLVAAADLTVLGWPGLVVPATAQVTVPSDAAAGTPVGTVTAGGASVPVRTGART